MNTRIWLGIGLSCALCLLAVGRAQAAGEGERCGRAGSWSARCDAGLECDVRWTFWRFRVGVCVAAEKLCGGKLGASCGEDEFCSYPPEARCGAADQTGVCEPRPEACTDEYEPVCGCDGVTYGNACSAHAAGASVASAGVCSECESDADCPFGVCDRGVTCAAIGCPPAPPNRCTVCGDGSPLRCRRAVPSCPEGQVPEIIEGCFGACVDRATCEPPAASSCEYDGKTYQPGEGFPSSDGCNQCSCTEQGRVICTLRACVCNYDDPAIDWKSRDAEECTRLDFRCPDGTSQFANNCGCGCRSGS